MDCGSDVFGKLGEGRFAEERFPGGEYSDDRADRARHSHAVVERDRGALEKPAELLLGVTALSSVALVVGERLERAMVALVQKDELAVVDHLVDEVVDQRGPCVNSGLPVLETAELVECLASERVEAQMELQEDVLLALEVVVERGLRGAEPF